MSEKVLTEQDVRDMLERVQRGPKYFFDAVLGCTYWSVQLDIAEAIWKHKKVSVKSCHGPGKTYITARIALAFLHSFPGSIVLTTAPTFRQVKELTWREISGARANSFSPLGGQLNKTQLNISDNWFAMGFSTDNPHNIQGFHAQSGYMLVIVEEAAGVNEETFEALSSILTSANSRLLLLGNPTVASGEFFESFFSDDYVNISIPAYITPNFTANGITSREKLAALTKEQVKALPTPFPYLVTPQWAWERYHKLGPDHPMFLARVEAEFPSESPNTLIPYWAVEKCITRIDSDEDQNAFEGVNTIGIDVARFGGDDTVLTALQKTKHVGTVAYNGKDTMKTVAEAVRLFDECGFKKKIDYFIVDDTGVGGGVSDRLRELEYNVIMVNFAEASSDPGQYANIKAEIFDNLARVMKAGEITLRDEPDLVKQISTVMYDYTSNQQLAIVSKKEMKKRGLPSPDRADSLALAVWGRTLGVGVFNDDNEDYDSESDVLTGNLMDEKL